MKAMFLSERDEPSAKSTNIRIDLLLRAGTMASAAVILLDGIGFLIRRGQSIPTYNGFKGTAGGLNTAKAIGIGLLHGDDLAIIPF